MPSLARSSFALDNFARNFYKLYLLFLRICISYVSSFNLQSSVADLMAKVLFRIRINRVLLSLLKITIICMNLLFSLLSCAVSRFSHSYRKLSACNGGEGFTGQQEFLQTRLGYNFSVSKSYSFSKNEVFTVTENGKGKL